MLVLVLVLVVGAAGRADLVARRTVLAVLGLQPVGQERLPQDALRVGHPALVGAGEAAMRPLLVAGLVVAASPASGRKVPTGDGDAMLP